MGAEVFHSLKKVLSELGFATGVGDEGASRRIRPATRRPSRPSWRPSRRPDMQEKTCSWPSIPPPAVSTTPRRSPRRAGQREPLFNYEEMVGSTPTGYRSTPSSASRTEWPRMTGKGGRSSPRPWVTRSRWWVMMFVTNKALRTRVSSGRGQLHTIKVNQIGTRRRLTPSCWLIVPVTPRLSATAQARPKTAPLPTWRWRSMWVSSRPARRVAQRAFGQVQPAAAHQR